MKDPSLVSAYFPMSSLAPARRVGVLLQRRPAASLCWIWWTLSAAQSTVCVMGQYSDSNVVCKNIFPSWGLLNSLLFNCKTSFQVKINHEITKNPHFPKTCIKIVTLFTQPFRSPLPIFVGIFTHGHCSLQFDPYSAFRSSWLQWHSGRGAAAPAPDSAQQLQLYLAPASKNRCEVLGGELIFISTQRELWTQTLKQATNDDWQGGIFTVRE